MKKCAEGINTAREIAAKMNQKNGGEMCAYIYEDDLFVNGYWVMDECDEPDGCWTHLETWQYGEISYSAV